MRDELHLMELADRYLDGTMNASERAAFEARAAASAELRQVMEDQRALREGIARLPLRATAAKAYRAYRFRKPGPWIGGAAIVAVITGAALLWMNSAERAATAESPSAAAEALNEGEADVLHDTVGTHLRPLVLSIQPEADTTVLTPGGLAIDIPRGAFLDAQGRAISEAVRVTVLEALDAARILKAGLSTLSGDTLLETGGMFYLDARHQGERVAIDPAKPITVMVPCTQPDPGMMLYQGIGTEGGRIDWRDPEPVRRSLVPVDITTLDFYPPRYVTKLTELGQDAGDKGFRDSLYFAFSTADARQPRWSTEADSTLSLTFSPIGIDPAKVKAFWNPRFNGTNLATREFEDRMRAIHGTCANAVLDLYVHGLEKDLSELDAHAARLGHPAFAAFAKRKDGRVDLPAHAAKRLSALYERWSRAEAEAIRRTQQQYWVAQRALDAESDGKSAQQDAIRTRRDMQLLQEEFESNFADACRQLGIAKPGPATEPPPYAYVAPVTRPGWFNIDRPVYALTASRTSGTIADPVSRRQATIAYAPFSVRVDDRAQYTELTAHLVPRELNSFVRMADNGIRFTERVNKRLTYDLVCIGMRQGQRWAAAQAIAKDSMEARASLQPVSEEELEALLCALKPAARGGLIDEARFALFSASDRLRRSANVERERLRRELLPVVFPCGEAVRESRPLSVATDRNARYPYGEDALMKLLRVSQRNHDHPLGVFIEGRVEVDFWVLEDGSLADIRITKPLYHWCDRKALELFRAMPRWQPALRNGKPRRAQYRRDVWFVKEENQH